MLQQSIELAIAAEQLGADGAYFRVHQVCPAARVSLEQVITVARRAVVLLTATVSTDNETFTDPPGPLGDVLELQEAIANANHAAAAIRRNGQTWHQGA